MGFCPVATPSHLRLAYKPHSVRWKAPPKRGFSTCAIISLGGASPRRSLQPTRGWPFPQKGKARMETSSLPSSTDDFAPAWPCSRRGLPGHLHYGKRRWSLTPPFHHDHPHPCAPLPVEEGMGVRGLFVSVALFRQVHASRRFPRPGCYPTPCSKECGLSSIPTTQDRDCPTSLRRFHHTRVMHARQLQIVDIS